MESPGVLACIVFFRGRGSPATSSGHVAVGRARACVHPVRAMRSAAFRGLCRVGGGQPSTRQLEPLLWGARPPAPAGPCMPQQVAVIIKWENPGPGGRISGSAALKSTRYGTCPGRFKMCGSVSSRFEIPFRRRRRRSKRPGQVPSRADSRAAAAGGDPGDFRGAPGHFLRGLRGGG